MSNLIAASIIALALAFFGYYDSLAFPVLLLGFWLMMLMFGTRIKRFLND